MDAPGSAELTAVTSQLRDHSFDDTLAHSRTLPSSLSFGETVKDSDNSSML
jgi:hypothetical protein